MKKSHALLVGLLAFAFRLWVGWSVFLHPTEASSPDGNGYHQLAAALTHGQFPSLFRTPGYPLFLALLGATSSEQITVVLLVQMLLDALTAVLLMAVAWQLFQDQRAALLTGFCYAFCPVMARLCAYILSEQLAIFLLIASLFLALTFRGWVSVWLQSLGWFAATMVRPSFFLLPLIVSAFLLARPALQLVWKRQAAVVGLYLLLLLGWIGFNYARSGLAVISTNPQVSFYIYEPPTVRLVDQLSWPQYIRLAVLNPPEFDRQFAMQEKAIAHQVAALTPPPDNLWFMQDDPRAIQETGAKAGALVQGRWPTLLGIHLIGVLQSLRPVWNSADVLNRVLDALRMLLLPVAVWWLVRRRQWWLLGLLLVWTTYALLPPGPVGAWRFRSLAEPVFSLTLATALSFGWRALLPKQQPQTIWRKNVVSS